jgi:proline racemase
VAVRTSYAGVVGDADAAIIVEGDGCHLACTSSSVLVVSVVARHGIIVIVIDVSAGMLVLQQIDR